MIILFYITLFLVTVVVLFYIFGYAYLFSGISKTYLRGKSSANIDDGKLLQVTSFTPPNPFFGMNILITIKRFT